jgi:hypothetical protein
MRDTPRCSVASASSSAADFKLLNAEDAEPRDPTPEDAKDYSYFFVKSVWKLQFSLSSGWGMVPRRSLR